MNEEIKVELLWGTKETEFVDFEEIAKAFVISQ